MAGPDETNTAGAVGRLELLLDRVGALAAHVSAFLLDPTYRSMLNDDERAVADALKDAHAAASSRSGPIATEVTQALTRFGAPQ